MLTEFPKSVPCDSKWESIITLAIIKIAWILTSNPIFVVILELIRCFII
jgi:hypothetical protein